MNAKKMVVPIAILVMMVAAIFVMQAAAFTAPNANNDRVEFAYSEGNCNGLYVNMRNCTDPGGINDTPTLRIYGEDNVSAAFPYTDPEGPFDPMNPEAPGKDFVVFNPAYIGEYDYGGVITVSGDNGREKTFVRQWYVPRYPEPRGDVWTHQDTKYSADIVTEYSYMLLNAQNKPAPGTAQQSGTSTYWTNFWLPIGSDGSQIGLDSFQIEPGTGTDRMVQLKGVGDYNGDGKKDINITTRDTLLISHFGWFQFLDHAINVTDLAYDSSGHIIDAVVDLYYIGNDNINEVTTDDLIVSGLHLDIGGKQVVAGRHTYAMGADPSFTLPWYLEVESIGLQGVYLNVGRLLHTRETFFVDGAEYDIAMIYGPNTDDLKYITIRNPVPKYYSVELDDLSIVKTPVQECDEDPDNIDDVIPMLPPFNMNHKIVDDIGIPHYKHGLGDTIRDEPDGIKSCADKVEKRIVTNQPPFVSYFVDEDVETRFKTNLLEILDESDPEGWNMLCTWTLPWRYTAMVYPDVGDMTCGSTPVPDADFLVTTSGPANYTSPQPECIGDLNDDGIRNFDDVLVIVANWGPCSGCSEDLNSDGYVNFADALVIVANWGPCP
ncbi:hypothetical protein CW696_01610 [ANME-2 cluster archaeon]|nr:MAG: hypothetical protein CW696_01610 [ANME-2 cluster archaeon]